MIFASRKTHHSKLWWARDSHSEQQLRDVKNRAGTGCDRDYIASWTNGESLPAAYNRTEKLRLSFLPGAA